MMTDRNIIYQYFFRGSLQNHHRYLEKELLENSHIPTKIPSKKSASSLSLPTILGSKAKSSASIFQYY